MSSRLGEAGPLQSHAVAVSYGGCHADTDSPPNTNTNPRADTYADRGAHADSHVGPDSDANPDPYSRSYANPDHRSNRHTDTRRRPAVHRNR